MEEETGVVVEEAIIPEESGEVIEETAAEITEEVAVEESGDGEAVAEEEKLQFTQAELDAMVEKRLGRERRKLQREQAEAEDLPLLKIESVHKPEDFETTEDYIDALSTEKAEAIVARDTRVNEGKKISAGYQDQVETAVEKYADFEQVAHNPDTPISAAMVDAIKSSDLGAEIAYHLGKNPEEAKAIYAMPPMRQISAIGKLEGKLETVESKPAQTKAPAPLAPLAKPKTVAQVMDTTNPKSVDSMSSTDWIMKDRARRMKKMKAQG